jgi:hypothetical protein
MPSDLPALRVADLRRARETRPLRLATSLERQQIGPEVTQQSDIPNQ